MINSLPRSLALKNVKFECSFHPIDIILLLNTKQRSKNRIQKKSQSIFDTIKIIMMMQNWEYTTVDVEYLTYFLCVMFNLVFGFRLYVGVSEC